MIRILIADDHAIVRQGLIRIVEDSGEMLVVAECANGIDAVQSVRDIECDVVLLDIAMPGKNGIEILKQIKVDNPKLPVLILSTYPEDQYAVRLIKAGAAGYVTKDSAPMLIVEAVRRVASGKKYISPQVSEMLASDLNLANDEIPHASLSDREYQIFLLFAQAKTATEVAEKLALSVKTISTYRSRILGKMHLRNNAEVMQYAIKHHLVD